MNLGHRSHPKDLQCKLLAGAPALLAQLLLAVLAFASLAYKRHRERPQRPYKIWTMDVSKQVFSSGAGHICGLIIAVVASISSGHATSECAWYFVAYTFDTTLGVTLAILLHRAAVRAAVRWRGAPDPEAAQAPSGWVHAIAHCGDYGDPPSWRRWAPQMAEWVFATIAARAVCGIVVVVAKGPLHHVAALLDRLFAGRPTAELFAVMIFGPLLMNMVQAWVQDAVLKLKRGMGGGTLPPDAAQLLVDGDTGPLLPHSAMRSDGLHARVDTATGAAGGHSSPAAKMATHLQASKGGGAQWGKGAAAKPLELQPQPSPMEGSAVL
mmetsp:Transcript_18975/g.57310  ORF Transcript_18975/g.57310 Transcript_18975/m.57310 type:complete len:324 (-) Transcript_18975:5-976(-)